jgi:hypothetical protein
VSNSDMFKQPVCIQARAASWKQTDEWTRPRGCLMLKTSPVIAAFPKLAASTNHGQTTSVLRVCLEKSAF